MKKIKLKNSWKFTSLIGFFNFFIEYLFFFRWPIFGYKNQLNNNFRICSSVLSAVVICIVSFCCLYSFDSNITLQSILYKPSVNSLVSSLKKETGKATGSLEGKISRNIASPSIIGKEFNTEILLLFFAIIGAFFWDSRATYVSKWSYLANLYNNVIKEKILKIRKSLNLALAQDLVHLGFYRHSSFYLVFEGAMLESHIYKNLKEIYTKKKIPSEIKKQLKENRSSILNEIKEEYTEKEAQNLLLKYHEFLLS